MRPPIFMKSTYGGVLLSEYHIAYSTVSSSMIAEHGKRQKRLKRAATATGADALRIQKGACKARYCPSYLTSQKEKNVSAATETLCCSVLLLLLPQLLRRGPSPCSPAEGLLLLLLPPPPSSSRKGRWHLDLPRSLQLGGSFSNPDKRRLHPGRSILMGWTGYVLLVLVMLLVRGLEHAL